MRSLFLVVFFLIGASADAQETNTSIGFSLNPNFSSIRYMDDGSYPDGFFDAIKSGTKGSTGISGEFFFQYKLSDQFFITWGLGIQNYSYQTTYYSQTQIEHPTVKRETQYKQHYLQLNVSAKYRFYEKVYARAGIGGDFLVEQRAKRTETCPTCEYSYQGEDNSSIFNEAMLPVSLGLGYEVEINDHLNLMTELYGSMSMTNAFSSTYFSNQVQLFPDAIFSEHAQQRPFQVGLKIGVIRSF